MIRYILVLCGLLLTASPALANPLRIACVMDGDFSTTLEQRDALLYRLRVQRTPLYSSVELPADAQFSYTDSSKETLAKVDEFCRQLMQRTDLSLILSFDLYSAGALLRHNNGVTPVFLLSGDDAVSTGILPSVEDSGVDNVTASLQADSGRRKIEMFYDFLQFKRLGILYIDTPLGRASARYDEAVVASKENAFELIAEAITETEARTDCSAAVRRLVERRADAFFMGSLLCLDPKFANLAATLSPLTAAGIPALAQDSPVQSHAGALLALTKDMKQFARINTKKILQILQGQTPRSLPMVVPFSPLFSLNVAVAGELGFQPSYELFAASDSLFYDLLVKKK